MDFIFSVALQLIFIAGQSECCILTNEIIIIQNLTNEQLRVYLSNWYNIGYACNPLFHFELGSINKIRPVLIIWKFTNEQLGVGP